MRFEQAACRTLSLLDTGHRRRHLRPLVDADGAWITLAQGTRLLDCGSNDYLGLSMHPSLRARACEWIHRFGAGSRASRLLGASLEAMTEVETRLAAFKGAPAALVFSSGWQTNASVLPAMFALSGTRAPLILSDRLNHASLHAGCARWHQIRYRHLDYDHLSDRLSQARAQGNKSAAIIISETVFSMDGDQADVRALADIARRHDALLYLDEAHATGVWGPQGQGLGARARSLWPETILMGTLGKALGGAGAYIAASSVIIDYLINRCSGFIHTTAPPPALFGALDAALDRVPGMEAERALLHARACALRERLQGLGIDTLTSDTHIIPAVFGDEARTQRAQERLEHEGIYAPAIRPPTVPQGSTRLRFSLTAAHDDEAFAHLLSGIDTLRDLPFAP